MKWEKIKFVVNYKRIKDLEPYFFRIKEIFNDNISELTFLKNSLKDDFVVIKSKEEINKSFIQVTHNRIEISFSIKESETNITNSVKKHLILLDKLIDHSEWLFVGILPELISKMTTNDEINKILIKNLNSEAIDQDCLDFAFLYSKLIEDQYFLNIRINKIINIPEETEHIETNKIQHALRVSIDVNNKPLGGTISQEDIDKLAVFIGKIVTENNIDNFITGKLIL